jgi:hypothetical protein
MSFAQLDLFGLPVEPKPTKKSAAVNEAENQNQKLLKTHQKLKVKEVVNLLMKYMPMQIQLMCHQMKSLQKNYTTQLAR